jgi:spore coat polysaccharide biosynthesis predicted glycosyltransferase SpsG
MKAFIVCHAGVDIGLGHLSRCLVIAKALHKRFGADINWIIQGGVMERSALKAFRHRFIPLDCNLAEEMASEDQVDLVLFDLHPQHVPRNLGSMMSALRDSGTKIVAIDGLLAYRSELDLIFVPSFQFGPPAHSEQGASIVFGWDCFLLDASLTPEPWQPGRRVLILTGGSDTTRLGETWPHLLNKYLPTDLELHWVTGPFARPPQWPDVQRLTIVEHVAPDGLEPLMQQSNYAITVFGVSFFELLRLGVPTVVFSPYGSKDSSELQVIAEKGVALVANDEREAIDRLVELLKQDELARQMTERARTALKISGVERLCSEISALMAMRSLLRESH